jgi:hypothetical protein
MAIDRDRACSSVPCTVQITMSVDDELVETRSFTFT